MSAQEIVLSPAASAGISRARLALAVPLALAFVGLAVVAGIGVGKHGAMLAASSPVGIDPIVTGSITPAADQARAMKMLDR